MTNRGLLFSALNRIILIVFTLFFVIFISTLQYRPYPFNHVIKIVPILSLALLVLINVSGIRKIYIAAALIFSSVGDVLLAMSGGGYFIYGLSTFAVAHCFYITAFLTGKEQLKKQHIFYIVLLLFYSISVACILFPGLGNMTIPVLVYLLLITTMGITSVTAGKNYAIFITGASLFIISDSIIAVNSFLTKVQNSSFWIMITYYPAQLLITLGACLTSRESGKQD
jgi:uncharacterized membrane protein YhhN